jgi:site-specific DNA recombinase
MKGRNADLRVALYARVSSEKQAEANTIASQVAELRQRIDQDGCTVREDDCFVDDGVSGTILVRPALERLRDQVAHGAIDRLYVLAPDRLARKASYQALLIDELSAAGVELVFLNHALGKSPEDDLLLQVQGIIAEYERAKIMERARRGKLHAARQGSVNVLVQAPFGYRYVTIQQGGGQARYEVVLEEARVIRQLFTWVGQEHLSLSAVCRRLEKQQIPTRTGLRRWSASTIAALLKNPAFIGRATFGKTRVEPWRPGLRPRRGQSATPRRPYSVTRKDTHPIAIPVPALVSVALFEAANEQLAENRRRYRQPRRGANYLLQGLLVCPVCGYAWCGQPRYGKNASGAEGRPTGSYRCAGRMRARQTAEGRPGCVAKPIRTHDLDEAVWRDVCQLLRQPERIEAEYERRLQGKDDPSPTSRSVGSRVAQLKRGIARLIDAYGEGLLEKGEFEPKIRHLKERLARLEAEEKELAQEESQRAELRLVIGELEGFTRRMDQGLEAADWSTRREIIRALVKQIEVSDEQVRVVYRVNTVPFAKAPNGGVAQDCRRRHDTLCPPIRGGRRLTILKGAGPMSLVQLQVVGTSCRRWVKGTAIRAVAG